FPGAQARWDWDAEPMDKDPEEKDSCVAVYWPQQELGPHQSMNAALMYGLGTLTITDKLALSAPSSVRPDKEFVVTAYVYGATTGQKVTLVLPPGLELQGGEATQVIEEAAKRAQVFWKVKAKQAGTYPIEATSGGAKARPLMIEAHTRSIFG